MVTTSVTRRMCVGTEGDGGVGLVMPREEGGIAVPREKTPRDLVWDELAGHFGEPRTKTERTQFGKVVNELMETAATPEEVGKAAVYVKANFDNPSVFAVLKWFTVAQQQAAKVSPQQAEIEKLRRVQ